MKITVRKSFVVYVLVLLVLSGHAACIGLLVALVVHEGGHCLIARMIQEPIERIELTPFGGIIHYKAGCTPSKGVKWAVLAIAGPAGNYLCTLAAAHLFMPVIGTDTYRRIVLMNLSMMLLNLMPVFPLDGGSLLFNLGYYLFDLSRLIRILSTLGMVFGCGMCFICVFSAFKFHVLNLSLLMIGAYIALYAQHSQDQMLTHNTYTILHERVNQVDRSLKVAIYRLSERERLNSLLRYICRHESVIFLIEREDGSVFWLDEKRLCQMMIEEPGERIGTYIEKHANSGKKHDFSLETFP